MATVFSALLWLNLLAPPTTSQVTPALDRMFMGHSSWFIFQATNRIYKHYNFAFTSSFVEAQRMSFSSYPG